MFVGVLVLKISVGFLVGFLLDCIVEGFIFFLLVKKYLCKSIYYEGFLEGK